MVTSLRGNGITFVSKPLSLSLPPLSQSTCLSSLSCNQLKGLCNEIGLFHGLLTTDSAGQGSDWLTTNTSCCVSFPFNEDLGTPPTRRPLVEKNNCTWIAVRSREPWTVICRSSLVCAVCTPCRRAAITCRGSGIPCMFNGHAGMVRLVARLYATFARVKHSWSKSRFCPTQEGGLSV